jgi:hypothetical protein
MLHVFSTYLVKFVIRKRKMTFWDRGSDDLAKTWCKNDLETLTVYPIWFSLGLIINIENFIPKVLLYISWG